jgi:hypothetical protein
MSPHDIPVVLVASVVTSLALGCAGAAQSQGGGGGPGDHAPVISAVSASRSAALVGATVSLGVTASDPDGDPLSYAWAAAPGGCGTFSSTGTSSTVLTAVSKGTCTATVTVSAGGLSTSGSVVVTVVDTLPAGPAAMPRVGHTYSVLSSNGATSQAVSVSGLGQAVVRWSRGGDTGPNDGNVQDGYDARLSDPALGGPINNPAANVPIDYVIEASSGGAYTPLVTMTGNTYITRAHLVNLTGYSSVRMRLTSAPRHGGNGVYGTDLDVHDASQGTDDWWIALGDSLTTNVWNVADSIKFGSRIHALDSTRFPVAHEGGVSNAYMADFLWTGWQGTDGRPLFARWMDDFPGTYVILAIGQNDCNAGTNIDTMETRFRQLLDLVVAAGKIPVIPTLRWTYTNGNTTVQNIEAWNTRLVTIRASYPTTVLPYPDVYTRSKQQGAAGLLGDMTHLNPTGIALTQQDWDTWAMGSVYAPP